MVEEGRLSKANLRSDGNSLRLQLSTKRVSNHDEEEGGKKNKQKKKRSKEEVAAPG